MPRLIVSDRARLGLEKCRKFLKIKNPEASKRASEVIRKAFAVALSNPLCGSPLSDDPRTRKMVIDFGDSGYVFTYETKTETGEVSILSFRHQKEDQF